MPQDKTERWLNGLASLEQQICNALGSNGTVITPSYLRQSAATMRRCAPELAALGPPPRPLQPQYQLARQACAAFARAASLNVAAARVMPTVAGDDPALAKLFNESDAAINQGFDLISRAIAEAPLPPGN